MLTRARTAAYEKAAASVPIALPSRWHSLLPELLLQSTRLLHEHWCCQYGDSDIRVLLHLSMVCAKWRGRVNGGSYVIHTDFWARIGLVTVDQSYGQSFYVSGCGYHHARDMPAALASLRHVHNL